MTNMSNTRIACIGAAIGLVLAILIPTSPVIGFLAMAFGATLAVSIVGK